ncbi:hypothetical protein DSCW_04540 [Desulfosarcina widdelii]|uniref:Replication protein A C-terminal domain-containing protein n=1 Tax=Desulfosarcina widdelii TaxID=947919 RepID=A0A5K7Z991_9BACT|nr:hypothetical protein [Desulfosarcina widdelii]BBO73037.1 hypothetical protein DSCW_04540 [Desulfosarcina widdelii]
MANKTDAQIKRELKSLATTLHKAAARLDNLVAAVGKQTATVKKKTAAKKKAAPKKKAKRAPVRKKATAKKKAAPKKAAKTGPRNRVLGAIKKKKTGAKVADLAKSLKMNMKSVQNAVHRLKQQGLITNLQRGVYVAK